MYGWRLSPHQRLVRLLQIYSLYLIQQTHSLKDATHSLGFIYICIYIRVLLKTLQIDRIE